MHSGIITANDLYALISQDTQLKKTAGTHGGEYHGPCPFCGGRDRLVVWPNATKPGWWCRQCEKGGDAIQYLREQGYSYADACAALGVEGAALRAGRCALPDAPEACEPPDATWRRSGGAFVLWAHAALANAPDALAYLRGRGLTEATITAAELGYNPRTIETRRSTWGLLPDDEYGDRLWLPQGIVIPTRVAGTLWKIQIRRDNVRPGDDRYKTVTGSANALYGADSIQPGKPAMLVEGPFDAMAVSQDAGDVCGVCASGTSGARRVRWLSKLAQASEVLVALDADAAGDAASHYWIDALMPHARRWRPWWSDPAQMRQDGADLRAWVLAGLGQQVRRLDAFSIDIVARGSDPTWIYRLWDDGADRVLGEYPSESAAVAAAHVAAGLGEI